MQPDAYCRHPKGDCDRFSHETATWAGCPVEELARCTLTWTCLLNETPLPKVIMRPTWCRRNHAVEVA